MMRGRDYFQTEKSRPLRFYSPHKRSLLSVFSLLDLLHPPLRSILSLVFGPLQPVPRHVVEMPHLCSVSS